jgi:Domain of unknown function.
MGKLGNTIRHFRIHIYRVRALIEYGIADAYKSYRTRNVPITPKYKLSICAIAKNEGSYFAEWIDYHHLLGVEKFYIYDNESTDNTKEVLQPYIDSGLVEFIDTPGKNMQRPVYADCLKRFRNDSQWMAFIDLDEFIVPLKNKTIPDFLEGFTDYSAIQINWVCYGSGGQEKQNPGMVIERFRDHSELNHHLNYCIKTILQPRRVLSFSGAHECVPLYGKKVNPKGEVIKKYYKIIPPTGQDIIRVNHYAVKSQEEYQIKRNRGRAHYGRPLDDGYFQQFDRNEIKDDPIMEKYVERLKEIKR